jgi:hypothetical protein
MHTVIHEYWVSSDTSCELYLTLAFVVCELLHNTTNSCTGAHVLQHAGAARVHEQGDAHYQITIIASAHRRRTPSHVKAFERGRVC